MSGLELHARLDEPNRLSDGDDHKAGRNARDDRRHGTILRQIKVLQQKILRISICEETDRPCGDDTDQMRSQTTIEASYAFFAAQLSKQTVNS